MSSLVREEYGPTFPQLVSRAPRWVRPVLALAVLSGVLLLAWLLFSRGASAERFVHRDSPQFNIGHGPTLDRVTPRPGEFLRLEQNRNGLFVQSFAVRTPYAGSQNESIGALPVLASREIAELRRRYTDFELAEEGKARIEETPGYQISFRAKKGERNLYGRVVLLADPSSDGRRAVALDMLATPSAGVNTPQQVGSNGTLKRPFRSFRFGTETP